MLLLALCNIHDRECNICDNTICLLVASLRNGVRFITNTKFLHTLINVAHRESARISKFTEFISNVIVCPDCCLNIWLFDSFKPLQKVKTNMVGHSQKQKPCAHQVELQMHALWWHEVSTSSGLSLSYVLLCLMVSHKKIKIFHSIQATLYRKI